MIDRAPLHLIALAALPRFFLSFRSAAHPPLVPLCGNRDEGMTGKVPAIVHTAVAFDPSAQEAARQETA
jgi:hypothetical protein